MLVVGLLGLRWAGSFGSAFLLVAALGAGLVLIVLGRARSRFRRLGGALTGGRDGADSRPASGQIVAMVAAVMALGATALVVVALV